MHTPEYISIHQQHMNIRKKVPQTEKIQKRLSTCKNEGISNKNQSE
jgi:hypothetical protein